MIYEELLYEIERFTGGQGSYPKQIADYLHIKQNTYCQYESARRQIPIETLIALAKYYKVSTDYILRLTNISKPYPKD